MLYTKNWRENMPKNKRYHDFKKVSNESSNMAKMDPKRRKVLWTLLIYSFYLLVALYGSMLFYGLPITHGFITALFHGTWTQILAFGLYVVLFYGILFYSYNLLFLPLYILFKKELIYVGRPFLAQSLDTKIYDLTNGLMGVAFETFGEEGEEIKTKKVGYKEIISTTAIVGLTTVFVSKMFILLFLSGNILQMLLGLAFVLLAVFSLIYIYLLIILFLAMVAQSRGNSELAKRIVKNLHKKFPDFIEVNV